TVPIPSTRLPTAVTLHDLQHHDLPTHFDRPRRLFRRLAYDRAARSADVVIVPSEFVRSRALELLGLVADRVHVVPFGIDHRLFRPGRTEREPLLLYPARAWPHKNHRRLLEALVLLRRSQPDLRLVLTGEGLETLEPLPPGVERRGLVTVAELADLYQRAACLVYPSLYEGFGLPPLEAMACGCPVAATSAGAVPEVCGEAAVLFDPTDPEAIAAGVEEALARADELRERGLERAARATWTATARLHERAYRAAAEGGDRQLSARR
ncbi:MAG: glycosyltransferase family 4 protein, partial [Gaiellaceae bacterium]|nr:glycosyltransferase family 4 protein [Gaiellaceae bacterium]